MAGDRRARTEQTQYRKGREAEGTKIKTKNREERREKKKQRTGRNEEKKRNREQGGTNDEKQNQGRQTSPTQRRKRENTEEGASIQPAAPHAFITIVFIPSRKTREKAKGKKQEEQRKYYIKHQKVQSQQMFCKMTLPQDN